MADAAEPLEPVRTAPPSPASPAHPGRAAFGSGAGPSPARSRTDAKARSTPKAPALEAAPKAPPEPSTANTPAIEAAPPAAPELLSLDDDPVPPAPSSDPFAFADGPAPPPPKGGSRSRQKAIEPVKTAPPPESEPQKPAGGYVRPGERRQGKPLLLSGIIGTAAIALGVVAVIVFLKTSKQPEQTQTTARSEEPPAAPPVEPPPEEKKGADPKPGQGPPPKKDDKPQPKPPAATIPATMLALPRGGQPVTMRALAAKPDSIQRPSGTPVMVDVPVEKVRQFFAPENRVASDAVVVWQSGPETRYSVDTYSATTGTRVGRFEFDGDAGQPLCDVSPDGKMFVAAAGGKLSVWNLADKSRPIDGFDPYASKPDHKKAGLAAVYFGAQPQHLVTVSTAGAVHLFDVTTGKEAGEFIPPRGVPGKVVAGKNVSADAARASIALAVGGVLYQVATTASLPVAWKHDLGGEVGQSFAIAAAGVPGRIAYAFETDADKKKEKAIVVCLPGVQSNRVLHRWPAAAGDPTGIYWAGTSLAVVATRRGVLWIDAEGKSFLPVAFGEVPGGKGLHGATEVSHWYLVPVPGEESKSVLLELALPMANLIDFRNAAEARQPLSTLRLDDKGLWR